MTTPKEPRKPLPPWVDPIWASNTPEARREQLRRLAAAQERGSALFFILKGMTVKEALAQEARCAERRAAVERRLTAGQKSAGAEQRAVAAEQAAIDGWECAAFVEREGEPSRPYLALLGTVIFVLGILCGVVLAVLRLR